MKTFLHLACLLSLGGLPATGCGTSKPAAVDVALPKQPLTTPAPAKPPSTPGEIDDPCGDPGQADCAAPLRCCYPCGIRGCHNQCTKPCTPGPACSSGCPMLP